MTLIFVDKVRNMRKYQRDYFRTRLQTDLNNAKMWEQVVGRELSQGYIPGANMQLVEDTRRMLAYQLAYFKDRRQADLRGAKHYETVVDKHLSKIEEEKQRQQNPKLF